MHAEPQAGPDETEMSKAPYFPCSNESQWPVQVFEQVVRMLEPNRESYEPRDNSCGLRGAIADGPGPHRGRLRGQRLEPTEAHCACGQPHGIYEFVAGLEATEKLKDKYATQTTGHEP